MEMKETFKDKELNSAVRGILKKKQKMENSRTNIPYGYVVEGGKFRPDKIESEVVRWVFHAYLRYMHEPPILLADRLKTEQYIGTRKYLVDEKVREDITGKIIEKYISAELNIRLTQYNELKKADTPEEISYYLSCPLSAEVCKKMVDRTFASDDMEYLRLIYKIRNNPVYVGHLYYTKGKETLKVRNVHEPIISEEVFEAVAECMA